MDTTTLFYAGWIDVAQFLYCRVECDLLPNVLGPQSHQFPKGNGSKIKTSKRDVKHKRSETWRFSRNENVNLRSDMAKECESMSLACDHATAILCFLSLTGGWLTDCRNSNLCVYLYILLFLFYLEICPRCWNWWQ